MIRARRPRSAVARWFTLVTTCSLLFSETSRAGSVAIAVSPGAADSFATIDTPCPTFSWGAVAAAAGYELVVYTTDDPEGAAEWAPALRRSLAAAALSWTPGAAECLARGRAYAWTVRSIGPSSAVEEDPPSEWSGALLFAVTAAPSLVELESALAALRHDLAAEGGRSPVATAVDLLPAGPDRHGAERPGPDAAPVAPGASLAALPTPSRVAVRGEASDPSGVGFGVYGLSASSTDGSAALVGRASATNGVTHGVLTEVDSPSGIAGAFDNTTAGKVLSARSGGLEVFSVDGSGTAARFLALTRQDQLALTSGSTVVPGASFVRIGTSPTVILLSGTASIADGNRIGQLLVLLGAGPNAVGVMDDANTRLSQAHFVGPNDVLTLIWDGADWIEVSWVDQ